jgi:hypothetical protein
VRLALPHRVIAVLDRERGERRGPARGERRVEFGEVAKQNAERPAVGGDMVDRQEQRVFVVLDPDQEKTKQRAALEVEGAGGHGRGAALCLQRGLVRGQCAQVDVIEREIDRRVDDLDRLAIDQRIGGAQRFVAVDQRA